MPVHKSLLRMVPHPKFIPTCLEIAIGTVDNQASRIQAPGFIRGVNTSILKSKI
ncbi:MULTISPECIES: hypothetical protein [unclassified Microcoleus]|uniref:hypothetical protein n=1 Tax=unclassified Microcoleus TaxID=2642155 RepID=UPI002FCF7CA0